MQKQIEGCGNKCLSCRFALVLPFICKITVFPSFRQTFLQFSAKTKGSGYIYRCPEIYSIYNYYFLNGIIAGIMA